MYCLVFAVENTTVVVMREKQLTYVIIYNSTTKLLLLFSNMFCIGFGFEESSYFRVFSLEIGDVFPLDC